jgi:hypothetical protein
VLFAGGVDDGYARGWRVASGEQVYESPGALPDVPTAIALRCGDPAMTALGCSAGCTVFHE